MGSGAAIRIARANASMPCAGVTGSLSESRLPAGKSCLGEMRHQSHRAPILILVSGNLGISQTRCARRTA
jgi:hypothetical protein